MYCLPNDPRFIHPDDARVIDNEHCEIDNEHLTDLVLIAPGTHGKIGEVDILITQVHIESRQVEYTVSWWCEGRRYCERVPEYEITDADKTMKVGLISMSNRDVLSYSRTQSGSLAVYLGSRRIGTIIFVLPDQYAYVPAGLLEHTGETFATEDDVKDSLFGQGEGLRGLR